MFGFVIMSHRSPDQLRRLVHALNVLYDAPPIACHHDFSQAALETSALPANVSFVERPERTGWGKWSLVQATLSALGLLYRDAEPDWFVVLSGADYPVSRADRVERDLAGSGADAFIDAFPLERAVHQGAAKGDAHLAHHRARDNVLLARDRYLRAELKVPIVRFRPPAFSTTTERYPRLGRRTFTLPFDSPLSPFDAGYECYVGSQWFTANGKVARKLLTPSAKDLQLRRFYRNRVVPDESYFQTVICNDDGIRRARTTHRFAKWYGAHPIDLRRSEDLDDILASKTHFARKFAPGDPVLDALDAHLGIA